MSEEQTKSETVRIKAIPAPSVSTDLEARTVTHYVTVPTLDEDGEVLLPRGADISRFSKSPTVFDVHEYGSKSVVGSAVPGSWKVEDDGILCTTKFAERPPENLWPTDQPWEPDRLLWLYHTGDIKGWSIGFVPLEGRKPTKQDIEKWGDGCRWVHTRYRVLEYSVAPLPCNSDCLTLAMKGIISKRLADSLAKGERPSREAWEQKASESVKLYEAGYAHARSLIEAGKVDQDSDWSFDASDEDALLGDPPDWAAYGKNFLAHDTSMDEKTKGAWKYPFAKGGTLYRSGVAAISQRASQQNETDIAAAAQNLLSMLDDKREAKATKRVVFSVSVPADVPPVQPVPVPAPARKVVVFLNSPRRAEKARSSATAAAVKLAVLKATGKLYVE